MLKKFLALFLTLIFVFSFCACTNKGSGIDFYCFNTPIHIQSNDKSISKQTENEIKNLFTSLENEFSLDNINSFTYKFNAIKENESLTLTQHGVKVFSAIDSAYNLTSLFDISVYPLVKLWGFAPFLYNTNYTPPLQEEINQVIESVDYKNINIDFENKTIKKTNQNTKIDLGGIVKGYAVDLAGKILKDAGHTKGYISVGGSSLYLLSVDTLSIRHPRDNSGKSFISVNLKDKNDISLSTSGDYERFYLTTNGEKFCHIINPKTGYPTKTNIASATILGLSGDISDALTTALCLMEYSIEKKENSEIVLFIKSLINSHPNISVFAVYDDGENKVILTNKMQDKDFTLHDTNYQVVKL